MSANVFPPNRASVFGDPNLRLAPPTSKTPVTPSTHARVDMVPCSPTGGSPNLSAATGAVIRGRRATETVS
jgi:hypothetical protein